VICDDLYTEVITGLAQPIKRLPCRLLYGGIGTKLFEDITQTEDYYLTRSELALLTKTLPGVARVVGPQARVIEPGSGSASKIRLLISALDAPAMYVPIDIAKEQLVESAATLRAEYPELTVMPMIADFTREIAMPSTICPFGKTLVFFPGSTIGNFEPEEARRFLSRLATMAGEGALLLLGADSNANSSELLRAYDDRNGITAAFNLNVLTVLNAVLKATFNLEHFAHRAFWNADRSRIEMHLVSKRDQEFEVFGRRFTLNDGEHIVTEHCYKHAPSALKGILHDSGWIVRDVFADPERRMRLWFAAARSAKKAILAKSQTRKARPEAASE
jgi:dimethylhistidine N-methyltransferase